MKTDFYQLEFDGGLLARGFWLYVWQISVSDGRTLYYVGKTGDKASGASQSPFDRVSKHLGDNKNNNALRRHLGKNGINPESCRFCFRACGPIFAHVSTAKHGELCDITSGLEKALADAMATAGCTVINKVHCRKPMDAKLFVRVRAAFAAHFPALATRTPTLGEVQ